MNNNYHFGTSDYFKSPEWKIRFEAGEMLSYFLQMGKPPPNYREWKSAFKKRQNKLYEDCKANNISPIPEELEELKRQLSNKKKDIYSVEKHFVASWVAWNFDPSEIDIQRKHIIRQGNEALSGLGGLQKNMTDVQFGSGGNEREQTIKRLLQDSRFLQEWKHKRERYQTLRKRVDLEARLEVTKKALKTK